MPDALLVILGWALVALVVGDVFRTVLWSGQGAGPLTGAITAVARRIGPAGAGRRRRWHTAVGPATLVAIVAAWSVVLLAGFTLVLEMDPGAIRTAPTDQPTDWFERAYYVGYTLFTLGNGGYGPATDLMRAVTVLMNALGMFLLTLSVTYLLPVISASVGARSFASSVTALGARPAEMLAAAWDGQRIRLDHQLRELGSELSTLAHQHLAYPVLHLFHSDDAESSAPLAVADLDDLLMLLDAVEPSAAPSVPTRRQLRSSIEDYVETHGRVVHARSAPPQLALDELAAAGIPLSMDPPSFARLVDGRDDHRRQVHSLAGDRRR